MMDRINNFFKKNKLLKLASLLIALGIWLMVVNISDPEIKSSVSSNIDVDYGESLTNLDKYYSLDSYTAKVTFSVRTSQRTRVSASDFRVYIDMRDYSITGALPVYVSVDDRIKDIVSDVNVSPVVVHATTEDMLEKTFDIEPNIVGAPSEGFAVGDINYTPSHVTVYGPNSEIGKISRIGFNVNIEGATSNVWGNAEFIYYDANDNEITPDSRIVIKNSVSYDLPIYEKKNITLMAKTTGDPAEGYELGSVNIEPDFVEVYGDKSVLDALTEISLPASLLDITGASSDISASVSIKDYLPEGVYTSTTGNIALVARINKIGTTVEQSAESSEDAGGQTAETTQHSTEQTNSETETAAAETAVQHTINAAEQEAAAGSHGSAENIVRESDIREGTDIVSADSANNQAHTNADDTAVRDETVVSHGTGNKSKGEAQHTGGTN